MKEALIDFIETKKWILQKEGLKFDFYKPPTQLGFDDSFTLPLPKLVGATDFDHELNRAIHFIAGVYEIDPSMVINGQTDYFEILKKDAMYFKLSSDNLIYQKTLEVDEVWSFLKNISTSYSNYIEIEFLKKFKSSLSSDASKLRRYLNNLLSLNRLRVVSLEYQSFSVGVSADTFMGKESIPDSIQEFRSHLLPDYQSNVINMDFDSREQVNGLIEKFTEEERHRIFDPLVKSINNKGAYNVTLTDSKFKPKKQFKRIPQDVVTLVLPPKAEAKPGKKIGFYQTIVPFDLSKQSIKLKFTDLEGNSLFAKKLDQISVKVGELIYEENTYILIHDIDCVVTFNEKEENYTVHIAKADLSLNIENMYDLEKEINDKFTWLIDYYLTQGRILDERGQKLYNYLIDILPKDFPKLTVT
jgi:hypothetical protein